MPTNKKILRTTERNVAIIIEVDEEINKKYYDEHLKESLHAYLDAGILCGVTVTTYKTNNELVLTFYGQPEQIDELLKMIHSES